MVLPVDMRGDSFPSHCTALYCPTQSMFHDLSCRAYLSVRWWWEQKLLNLKQKILLTRWWRLCRNWIRKWPFLTIFLWIIANKQEFDLYWREFEIALYPVIRGRGYKTLTFRLYCSRYCKYLITVLESTWAIVKSFITGCLYPSHCIYWWACTKSFISLFVKLKYLRQINPSTLAALLLHFARVDEKTPVKRELV